MMFYPIDPTEKYSLFAIRLRKYKVHFYTRGAAGFLAKVFNLSASQIQVFLTPISRCVRRLPQLHYAGHRVLPVRTPPGPRPPAALRPGRRPSRALPALAGGQSRPARRAGGDREDQAAV